MMLTALRVTRRLGLRLAMNPSKWASTLCRVQNRNTQSAIATTVLAVRTHVARRCLTTKGRNFRAGAIVGGAREAATEARVSPSPDVRFGGSPFVWKMKPGLSSCSLPAARLTKRRAHLRRSFPMSCGF